VQALAEAEHVALDAQDVRERGIARLALPAREARVAQELLGIGERDHARAGAAERAHPPMPHDHAVGDEARGDGEATKRPLSQPASRNSSLFEAVSQISIERKCDRFGSG
jgi:hypothetical protein